jgi:sugar-specific transcriptional regulator TrmB
MMERISEILGAMGIGRTECRVYVALLELQEAKAGEISSHAGVATSNIYNALDSLMAKGIVSYKVKNNMKYFQPAPPESLNELFLHKKKELDKQKEELDKIIKQLKKINPKKETFSNYRYFEGIRGVRAMWHEINDVMDSGEEVLIYLASEASYRPLVRFYDYHHDKRIEKGVKERLVFPKDDRELGEFRKNELTDVRFDHIESEAEWAVVGDMLCIQYTSGKMPRGFLIKDRTFADGFRELFEKLWSIAEE